MNEIIFLAQDIKQTLTMTSREIAELIDKKHKNVKRDCEAMFEAIGLDKLNFERIYFDSMNRSQIEYILSKSLVETLIYGYSTKLRYWVIRRLHELEAKNHFLQKQLNILLKQYADFDADLSSAGRFLSVGGKYIKPMFKQEIYFLEKEIQRDLFDDQNDNEVNK